MVGKLHRHARNEFHLADGRKLSSMLDLAMALQDMNEDTFSHHVNSEKNDFATWLDSEHDEKHLALELVKSKDKKENELIILRSIIKRL